MNQSIRAYNMIDPFNIEDKEVRNYYVKKFQQPFLVKRIGIGNDLDRFQFYNSLWDLYTHRSIEESDGKVDGMIADNHVTKEYVDFSGPKVFNSWEPLWSLESAKPYIDFKDHENPSVFLYTNPDERKRWYYTVLPGMGNKLKLINNLKQLVHEDRSEFCVMMNRFTRIRNIKSDLIERRYQICEELSDHVDIYGSNKWLEMCKKHEYHKKFPTLMSQFKGYGGDGNEGKFNVFRRYTFALVLENSYITGYITEKLPQAIMCGCVPIYQGGGDYLEETITSDCYIDCKGKHPSEIKEIVLGLSKEQIMEYRLAGIRFLENIDDRFNISKHHRQE